MDIRGSDVGEAASRQAVSDSWLSCTLHTCRAYHTWLSCLSCCNCLVTRSLVLHCWSLWYARYLQLWFARRLEQTRPSTSLKEVLWLISLFECSPSISCHVFKFLYRASSLYSQPNCCFLLDPSPGKSSFGVSMPVPIIDLQVQRTDPLWWLQHSLNLIIGWFVIRV